MPLASVVLQTNNFILGTWSHCMKTIRNKEHIKDFALAAGAVEVKIPTITIITQKTNKALLRQTTKKKQDSIERRAPFTNMGRGEGKKFRLLII